MGTVNETVIDYVLPLSVFVRVMSKVRMPDKGGICFIYRVWFSHPQKAAVKKRHFNLIRFC